MFILSVVALLLTPVDKGAVGPAVLAVPDELGGQPAQQRGRQDYLFSVFVRAVVTLRQNDVGKALRCAAEQP